MLVVDFKQNDTDTTVILRDCSGRKICTISMIHIRPGRASVGFEAGPEILINRRVLDREKFPADYQAKPSTGRAE